MTHWQAYGGDKTFFRFDGTHNSRRPAAFYELVVKFLKATLLGSAEYLVGPTQQLKRMLSYIIHRQILYRAPSSNSMDGLPSDRARSFMTGRCVR